MAARKITINQNARTREKIRVGQLINRLTDHALGKNEMTATQVNAANILLKKSLPDLTATEVTGAEGGPVETKWSVEFVNATPKS